MSTSDRVTAVRDTQEVMPSRVTSSRLVGRDVEMIELVNALASAASGGASLFVIGGDSGIGKSRLVAALRERAEAEGAVTLTGDCLDLTDAELPYASIVAAIRPLAREQHPVLAQLAGAERSELARLLPMVDAAPPEHGDPGAGAQLRLFEALLALLAHLGRDAPALFVIEDLHWADRSTRSFISFLARSLSDERVLVVTTYRSDELYRRHPLRPLLGEIERQPRVYRIQLGALRREAVW